PFIVSGNVTAQSPAVVKVPRIFSNPTDILGQFGLVLSPRALPPIVENKAIHVIADADVSVYMYLPSEVGADGYLAIPTTSLGTDYYVNSYPASFGPQQLGVIAAQPNTHVTTTRNSGNQFLAASV